MDNARKRELASAYKERKTRVGLYALRCAGSGETWVGTSRNLDAQANSAMFQLRTGGHPNKAMQAAWAAHGADSFAYEELETIDAEDLTPVGIKARLDEREQAWRAELGAARATG